jgi:hypothetical protein
MGQRIRRVVIALLGLVFALTVGEARGEEFYYVMIFGSQSKPKSLQYTHTWATFIGAVGEGPDANNYALYQHTISWLPQSLDVRTWTIIPEPGVNLDLYRTLDAVYHDREHVTVWGPFQILPQVFERSLAVKAILDSGRAEYRAISTPRNLLISDCVHAVAAVDPVFGRGHYPLIRVGKPASRYIARQFMTRSLFDQYQTEASWLIPRLGLDRYPIEVVPPQQIPKRGCVLCRCPD